MSIYFNRDRKTNNASQYENVNLTYNGEHTIINSYQSFIINNSLLTPLDEQLIKKTKLLRPIIEKYSIYNSILDIGSSNGFFIYLSREIYKKCYILEHDTEYVKNILEINNKYNFNNISVINKKFNDITTYIKYDVILFLAIIHWIYSCTELNGNFDKIINKLANITNNVLIIEWIDKNDEAIKNFKHTSFNNNIITEEYCEENFIKSIKKYFNSYYVLPNYTSNTRKIYVVFKDFLDSIDNTKKIIIDNKEFLYITPHNSIDNGTSNIFISNDYKFILKRITHFFEHNVYEREVFWYEKLKNEDFVPKLIYKDDTNKLFITEYYGKRLSITNKPNDWKEQLVNILTILKNKYGWKNNDIKPTEILVNSNGKIGIVDFGWVSYNDDMSCGIGLKCNKHVPITENIINLLCNKFND